MIGNHTLALLLLAILFLRPDTSNGQGQTCATATAVTGGVVYTVDTVFGGFGNQYGCFQPGVEHAFWYVYTATYTGEIEITSCAEITTIDTRVSIYTGECSQLFCHAWNDDGNCPWVPTWLSSRVTFNVVEGEKYYIQWDKPWTPDLITTNFQWIINTCEARVEGTVYRDLNSNEVRDEGEPLYNAMIEREGSTELTYAGTDPYLLCSPPGEQTISVANVPLHHTAVPTERTYIASQVDHITGMDFAIQPIPGIHDGSVSIWGSNPWIGNNTAMQINYANIGTEPINAVLELHLDPMLEYVGATTMETAQAGNTIFWDLGMLAVGASGMIGVNVFTPVATPFGAETNSWVLLDVDESDVDGSNNFDEAKLTVVAAVDPNDKQVDSDVITPDEVADRKKVEYTIRFQNTGTAPAVNVIVRDTLDEHLDLTTFEMIGATHDFQLALNGREMAWTFPNIMLPDSTTDLEGSMGAFHFRIAANEDLIPGDQVQNNTFIYFDFADPIETNTVTTTVVLPTAISTSGVSGTLFLLHPSPTTGLLAMRWLGDPMEEARLLITDALGRQVEQRSLRSIANAEDVSLDLSHLSPGNYHINVQSPDGNAFGRFVIQR